MEVLTKDIETGDDAAIAYGLAGVLEGRVIELIPVPYGGDERPVVIIRPAVDEFMINKPA